MMRKLSVKELGRKTPELYKASDKLPVILVLDNVRSMMNTGSVFRTADAFLMEAVFLCGITATPPHRDIHRTALGATETVAWKYYRKTTGAVEQLKQKGFTIIALEQATGSIDLKDFRPVKGNEYALVFGNEVKGVDEEVLALCDYCVEIPQFGTKHSLNIAVSAGIVVWDFYSKLSMP